MGKSDVEILADVLGSADVLGKIAKTEEYLEVVDKQTEKVREVYEYIEKEFKESEKEYVGVKTDILKEIVKNGIRPFYDSLANLFGTIENELKADKDKSFNKIFAHSKHDTERWHKECIVGLYSCCKDDSLSKKDGERIICNMLWDFWATMLPEDISKFYSELYKTIGIVTNKGEDFKNLAEEQKKAIKEFLKKISSFQIKMIEIKEREEGRLDKLILFLQRNNK